MLDSIVESWAEVVTGAQDTAAELADNLTEVVLGGQETVRSVVSDVTDVPADVAGQVAEPAAEAAAAPFNTIMWVSLGALAGLVADEVLTGGKVRRSILG